MKKIIGIFIAFILLFGTGSVSQAEGSVDRDAVLSKIKTAWDDYAEYVTFDVGQVTIDEFKEIYHEALLNNPEYYFVSRSVEYESIEGYVVKATINYEFEDKYDYWNHRIGYNLSIDTCKRYIESDWTDVQKLQYINYYLCRLCDYDSTRTAKHNKDAYGALANKSAVCEGYAMAFMALCKSVGIDCYLVSSDSMEHAWNMVKLNDDYYMIDTTWNDSANDKYKYFMKSIAWFNSEQGGHKADDYVIHGLSIPETYECDDSYDDYAWEDCWEDEDAIKLNHNELIFYGGAIVSYDTKDSFSTRLKLMKLPDNPGKITWSSENTDIAVVDEDGNVMPIGFGSTNIVATYEGESYKCHVDVREVRVYFWHEYSGEPESNRWIWYKTDRLAVGQSVKYKLTELTYDENGELESETDVTDKIKLIQESGDYFKIENGTFTALKADADKKMGQSRISYNFKDTNVDFYQYILFYMYTREKTYENSNTQIVKRDDCFTFMAYPTRFEITFDDVPMQPADWIFYKCKAGDITWKISDESVIKLGKETGCVPLHVYSEVEYEVLKTGWVTVSVYYGDDLIRRESFYMEKEDETSDTDDYEDEEDFYDDSDSNNKKDDSSYNDSSDSKEKSSSDSKSSGQKNQSDKKTSYSDEWVNGKWYNSDGTQTYKATLSWKQDANGWWVEDSDGWYPTNQWQKIDGKWYYFCADGYMDYSEYRDGCWLGSDGAWIEEYYGGTWNLNSTGWWYSDSSGWYPANEWLWIDGVYYFFDSKGYCTNP